MQTLLILGVAAVGLGFLLVLFQFLKKGSAIAAKLPVNFLLTFLLFGVIGLSGFSVNNGGGTPYLLLIVLLLIFGSLTMGTVFTNRLYNKWEWSAEASLGRRLLYLFGIMLTAAAGFWLAFMLTKFRMWQIPGGEDITWSLLPICLLVLLPIIMSYAFEKWNLIPKLSQVRHYFKLPVGTSPPFIETGGQTITFQFVIPLDFRSEDVVQSKVAVPLARSLQDVFHYKLHEHNIVKRYAKKINIAEENKREKIYGWYFYRTQKGWWNLWTKKTYLDPKVQVGAHISNGETIFTERVKIWEH